MDINLSDHIRDSSRRLVREFGFMNSTIASTALTPSALHTLLEIDLKGPQTAAQLCHSLNLEKSSVSRLLKKLVSSGEIKKVADTSDARSKSLHLTSQGYQTVGIAHKHARQQTQAALGLLSSEQQLQVKMGLSHYAQALEATRGAEAVQVLTEYNIVEGYQPGAIGRIAYLFSLYFSKHYQFGQFFESKVATEMAEFTGRLSHEGNQLWTVVGDNEILGSIVIDAEDIASESVAHLRWFILDKRLRGSGMGRQLLQRAVDFCDDHGFDEIHLWTVKGLDAASHLYDQFGFSIVEEQLDDQWGRETVEQKRVRLRRDNEYT